MQLENSGVASIVETNIKIDRIEMDIGNFR